MTVRFVIDTDKLTVGDMLLIEDAQDGNHPMHKMTSLMARFMAGPDGTPLPYADALQVLSALTLPDFTETARQFGEAIQRKAVPPAISDD